MSDRKAELEKKKAKLQAIREQKERLRKEKEKKDGDEAVSRGISVEKDQGKEIDEMLSSLGVAPVSDVLSSLTTSPNKSELLYSSMSTPDSSAKGSLPQTPATGPKPTKKIRELSIVSLSSTNIPPKEVECYTKAVQTTHSSNERDGSCTSSPLKGYFEDWWRPRKDGDNIGNHGTFSSTAQAFGYYVLTYDDGSGQAEDEDISLTNLSTFQSKLPPGILSQGLPQVKEVAPAVTSLERELIIKEEPKKVRELSDAEKMMIVHSEDFQQFMDRAGRVMERALSENVDIYTDYTGALDDNDVNEDKSSTRLSLTRVFYDEHWSKNRLVTSLDWSQQFPELTVASYNISDAPHEPDGVVLVWNTKFKKNSPEYVFHCQSRVLSATFARFHPNLILGSTYSGQIVLWDNRAQKKTPIQRTPLSNTAHTHPVYCIQVVGTQNAHNLISISTDGRLCCWSLDMLTQPVERLDLTAKQSKSVSVSTFAFLHDDVNKFVFGSQEGAAYSACRHTKKAGVVESYESHIAPITAIDTHCAVGNTDFSHLFLTSSIDWTIKLWNIKESKPIHSFENNNDYVSSVAWSPVHPSVFAAIDVTGRLDLWNLNNNTESPTASTILDNSPLLKSLMWSQNGTHLSVGDEYGKISVFQVGEQMTQPRHDDWSKLSNTLQELKSNQTDEMDKSINYSSGSVSSVFSRSSSILMK
ncbi:cytoplasmic dynein 1 intermediate chain isoform X2 [Acyrthosiphon pisum]|uniref:Cytoplasmic dynein 1 intermediate chain n=1 Tax=Acyrthosiphon pisum TaxID=7029 RepID=A0A8R2D409_ACYPI|nr:cytoplasmic dynein 1 intermediate chain isoform X2 [Acyrthosiphon pisum]|eukprot:XP_016658874.1 PREDICTED: cytoplasmic dynein 1 intermediate chain isoform X4 [Acyrthosiphon pisum]